MPISMLHPGLFTIGIACVSIPILIHLLKRKRRPIPWGAMRFLEQAYRKRRRRLTIEQLIMLALRCTLIALIAAGVGALMLGKPQSHSGPQLLTIIIDNSIGSALETEGTRSLETQKHLAITTIETLDPANGDRAILIAGAQPAKPLVLPPSSDFQAIKDLIGSIEPTDSRFDLVGSLQLANHQTTEPTPDPDQSNNLERILLITTDARGPDSSPQTRPIALPVSRVLAARPSSTTIDNIGIRQATASRALITQTGVALPVHINLTLIRSGNLNQPAASTITISNTVGHSVGTRRVQWDPGQSELQAIVPIAPDQPHPTAKALILRASIDADANPRDNTHLIAIPTAETLKVGILDRPVGFNNPQSTRSNSITPSRWVQSALSPGVGFGIETELLDASRASSLLSPRLDAIIILAPAAINDAGWRRINELNAIGIMVLIAQDPRSESTQWTEQANQLVPESMQLSGLLEDHSPPSPLSPNSCDPDHSLLRSLNAEMPDLTKPVTITRRMRFNIGETESSSTTTCILALDTGEPIIQSTKPNQSDQPNIDRGTVVLMGIAIDLDWSNLPARALFVPMMQELIRQGVGQSVGLPCITAGDRLPRQPWVASNRRINPFETTESSANTFSTPAPAESAESNIVGVLAQIDQQGITRGIALIEPDADSAITTTTTESAQQDQLAKLLGIDLSSPSTFQWLDGAQSTAQDSSPTSVSNEHAAEGSKLSLWLLLIAATIALIESILAKVFSLGLSESIAAEARA